MRVLQICHSYYPPFLDCARQYAALFDGTPYKVLTVYLTGEPNEEVIKWSASDEVIFLGFKSREVRGLKLKAIAKIKQLVNQENFLFCIAHRVKPTYVALLASNLQVISVHHNYNDYTAWSRRPLVNFYKNRLLMLGVSNAVRDDLRRDLKRWDHARIQTLYNRIDVESTQLSMFSREDALKALGISKDVWVVGNVGRLHRDKDQATLLRGFAKALPQLPLNAMLVIIGSGPLQHELERLTLELNIQGRVKFLGQIPDAKYYFKAFDIFALTSDNEPFGMVLLEAMAAELPIICSDNGGGAEVVIDAGVLFKFNEVDDFSEKLIYMTQQPTMGFRGNSLKN